MENTLKNKEKFFAQYYGQNVLRINDTTLGFVDKVWNWNHPDHYLDLKRLSDITQDDAIGVAKIICDAFDFGNPEVEIKKNCIVICVGSYILEIGFEIDNLNRGFLIKWDGKPQNMFAYDAIKFYHYLTSKGYLLPFHDLTTEQIIEYGWAKIKTQ